MARQDLSAHDSAIWRTVWFNDLIDRGRLADAPAVHSVMAPSIGEGERFLASGTFALLEFVSGGDGTYVHKSGGGMFVLGSAGLVAASAAGMMAGAAGRAIGNSSRRKAAAQAAQPQWRQVDSGGFDVSQFGFYLHTMRGIHSWSWWSITSAELVGPGQVMIVGDSDRGAIRWILLSDWAELVFTMWARARHPEHPQFVAGRWVPPGWIERASASDYDLPPVTGGRWGRLIDPPAG